MSADFAFGVLHIIHAGTPLLDDVNFDLARDAGYAEMFQYTKFVWIMIMLVLVARKTGASGYAAWVLVFAYLLVDDAMQIHERVGAILAERMTFAPPLGLRLQDLGELAVTAAAGTLLLAVLATAYFHGSPPFRRVSQDLALLVLILVFFGVVVDMAQEGLGLGRYARFAVGTIEDGGEMLAVSLITWYVFLLTLRNGDMGAHLSDLVRRSSHRESAGA